MNYKELINDLQNKLNAYKFFDDERLSLLKVALDLQIINRALTDLKGFDNEINQAQIYVEQAMNEYSKMFAKYELAAIELETMRMQIGTLLLYVNDLEKEVIKLNSNI
jgi:hypothetical protein